MKGNVLLTGISGFLGSHTAIQLLEKGYEVTGTLRSLDRAESIKTMLARHTQHVDNLRFAQAELTDATVWLDLTKGMDYVQHVASPFPRELPKHEDELIVPAKNGVLNVLQAASVNRVRRVVLTSSSGNLLYGKPKGRESGTFDETVSLNGQTMSDLTPYLRSKLMAEKAAWDFMATDTSGLELVAVLPGVMLGPVLENDFGTTADIVLKMLNGSLPAVPATGFDLADVRSVADALVRAMEMPGAAGQRFAISAGFLTLREVADILRQQYPDRKIPRIVLPDFLTRVLSWFDSSLAPVLLDLGHERKVNHGKAEKLLGWQPLDNREAVISCARSLLALGLVK